MAVTEERAVTMWCPFARVLNMELIDDARVHMAENPDDVPMVSEGNPHNRLYVAGDKGADAESPAPGANCVGRKCMSWRATQSNVDVGYCGLAGP